MKMATCGNMWDFVGIMIDNPVSRVYDKKG